KRKSFGYGMKAEAIRLAAFASLPLPGSYELTTTGLALLKKKIEKGEVDNLTLKAFRDFTPLKNIKIDKNKLTGSPYLRIYTKNKKLFFDIIYRNKLNEKLFLYGSLMDPKVEYYITGEIVEGYKDILIGYRKNNILIENKFYPIAVKYINGEIEGKIININKRKIKLIDKYEGRNYKRKKVVLKSGISAWVYVRK
ncbi:gamma-glutamylcyclotransferase, partial [Candidatus Woesearchaeota archaeon]|nr:gamma-glutamylcyclotransferase [Candidatus Woesearchaeota archaeon]